MFSAIPSTTSQSNVANTSHSTGLLRRRIPLSPLAFAANGYVTPTRQTFSSLSHTLRQSQTELIRDDFDDIFVTSPTKSTHTLISPSVQRIANSKGSFKITVKPAKSQTTFQSVHSIDINNLMSSSNSPMIKIDSKASVVSTTILGSQPIHTSGYKSLNRQLFSRSTDEFPHTNASYLSSPFTNINTSVSERRNSIGIPNHHSSLIPERNSVRKSLFGKPITKKTHIIDLNSDCSFFTSISAPIMTEADLEAEREKKRKRKRSLTPHSTHSSSSSSSFSLPFHTPQLQKRISLSVSSPLSFNDYKSDSIPDWALIDSDITECLADISEENLENFNLFAENETLKDINIEAFEDLNCTINSHNNNNFHLNSSHGTMIAEEGILKNNNFEIEENILNQLSSDYPFVFTSEIGSEAIEVNSPNFKQFNYESELTAATAMDCDDVNENYTNFIQMLKKDIILSESETDDEDYKEDDDVEEIDNEEFRNDRAVQITIKELVELLDDSQIPISTDPSISSIPVCTHTANHVAIKRKRKQPRQIMTRQKELALLRLQNPLYPFTEAHLETLKEQMNQCFQLMIQQIALCNDMRDGRPLMLEAVDRLHDTLLKCELSNQSRQTPSHFHTQGLSKLSQLFEMKNLKLSLRSTNNSKIISNSSASFINSIPAIYKSPFKPSKWDSRIGLPKNVISFLQPFEEFLAEDLALKIETGMTTNRLKYTLSEDSLLLFGLRRYGTSNWEIIQRRLIPTKTVRQISTRYKNLTSRRAPNNPLKDFYFELTKPLTPSEEDLLYMGVQNFGKNFFQISRLYLPNRPAAVLKKLWFEIDESRKIDNIDEDEDEDDDAAEAAEITVYTK